MDIREESWSSSDDSPWYDNRGFVQSVRIENGVTSIADFSFFDCANLTSVMIPDSVTRIGIEAFEGCTSLASITIPKSVTSIGSGAFYGCTNLTSIDVARNNSIYCSLDGVLYSKDMKELIACPGGKTSVIIPGSVISIEYDAFYGCTNLTSIDVAGDNSAYCSSEGVLYSWDMKKLIACPGGKTSVAFPGSVKIIENSAFENCSNLTSVAIPGSVQSIGNCAFESCTSLTSITIPDSVTNIGSYAFYDCTGLTDVYYSGTEAEWAQIFIGGYNECLTNAAIHFKS